jgi:uncharacterized MAPEG superfamily protein
LLPYLLAGASLPYRNTEFGNADLQEPRAQGYRLTGAGGRARDAQENAWEAITIFAVVTLIAFMAGVDPAGNWNIAAMIWVVARALHGVFYIMGKGTLRIAVFAVGMLMNFWIIGQAFRSAAAGA